MFAPKNDSAGQLRISNQVAGEAPSRRAFHACALESRPQIFLHLKLCLPGVNKIPAEICNSDFGKFLFIDGQRNEQLTFSCGTSCGNVT